MNKVQFSVSLSNGETVYEGKGNFEIQEGALSPWQRLLLHISENNLSITSLSLYAQDGQRWNLPSAGKNPKFKEFANNEKPVDYKMFRKMGGDLMGNEVQNQEIYTVAQAKFADGTTIQIWVDEKSLNSWSTIIKP